MRPKQIFSALAAFVLTALTTGCDDEKDLVIIDGNLPIKTSTLYMVGDATPNGWSLDDATPLEASADDALVFGWEGDLNAGELKLCLATTSWDVAFIRPENNGEEISETPITDQTFAMWAGDPDNKWKVAEAGKYSLSFDLRNWTMSTEYLGASDETPSEPEPDGFSPIEAETLYIVGDAAPCGWDIDSPTLADKQSDYIFVYEGALNTGELKACISTGDWMASFVRPSANGCKISKSGVESSDFVFTASPDDKWVVEDAGDYRLTFDLEHGTINAEYLGETGGDDEPGDNENAPIETETLYMIGDATPNGWSMDNASEFTKDEANPYVFTWTGTLAEGNMKACLVKDGTFSCPFLRPTTNGVEISSNGVADPGFVFTTSPDDQWRVTEAGTYKITFDLEHWTITAEKL